MRTRPPAHLSRAFLQRPRRFTVGLVQRELRFRLVLLGLLLAATAACRARAPEYPVRGQITAIAQDRSQLTLSHEDIPGFMPAMTMAYSVDPKASTASLTPGDLITATLVVPKGAAPYLTHIERTGHAPVKADAPASRVMDLLDPGDTVPDTELQDQDGHTRRLSDWKGKAIAVTFIYTNCPMQDFCPLMDRRFAEIQKAVAADPALARSLHLVSVSFDPARDTPPVLKAHAKTLGANPELWSFLTAAEPAIETFASRFGVSIMREGSDASITHNLRTAVIDPAGRLVKIYSGSDWSPETLLGDLRNAGRR